MRIFVNFIVSHVYINVFLKRLIGIWITSIRSVKVKANPPVSFRGGRYNPQWREQQMGSWGYLAVHGVTHGCLWSHMGGRKHRERGESSGTHIKNHIQNKKPGSPAQLQIVIFTSNLAFGSRNVIFQKCEHLCTHSGEVSKCIKGIRK